MIDYRSKFGPPVLDWRFPLVLFAIILFIAIPVSLWSGLTNPALLKSFAGPWPMAWTQLLATTCAGALFFIPLAWVLASRVLDLFAFFMAQNALLICGYFFLNTTAWKLEGLGGQIEHMSSLVVLVNSLGFAVMFMIIGLTYFVVKAAHAKIPPLHASPEEYDRRFTYFLRAAGLLVAFVLALPMVKSGTIPMLSADPTAARAAIVSSDVERSLYLLGFALVPFILGGLLLLITRNPLRLFGIDGLVAGSVGIFQLLSGNRFPLAIAFFVTITLITIERRWPRSLLIVGYISFMLLLTGVSGFTGILRQNTGGAEQGNIVQKSLQEAFYGDNLIDLRDASWVLSQWDFEPLLGRTYMGGLTSMLPSGIFPLKKQWHLGLTAIRIVGWDTEKHFGLRITFFGESYLNFGPAGVVVLAVIMGCLFGLLLRTIHLVSTKKPPCLHYSLKIVILMQMCMPLANTSDAFTFWAMGGFLFLQWIFVDLIIVWRRAPGRQTSPPISA